MRLVLEFIFQKLQDPEFAFAMSLEPRNNVTDGIQVKSLQVLSHKFVCVFIPIHVISCNWACLYNVKIFCYLVSLFSSHMYFHRKI